MRNGQEQDDGGHSGRIAEMTAQRNTVYVFLYSEK